MKELLSSIILIGMGAYGIILYTTNKLSMYIHPRFFEESFIASIVAISMGIICFAYFTFKGKYSQKDLASLFNKKILIIIVLIALSFFINTLFIFIAAFLVIAPNQEFNKLLKYDIFGNLLVILMVAIGLLLPAKTLSSVTASQRSIDLNSINLTQNTISAVQNFNKSTANYSLGDWIAMQGFNPDPLFYKDKDVKISGFIYKPESLNLEANTVMIARFIITCCAVDARPVGLGVILPLDTELKTDDWVEIKGKFSLDNNQELVVITDEVNKIDEPSNPYIF